MDAGAAAFVQPPMPMAPMNNGGWSPCPLTVRLEPMPFFVADWQVANALRHCGECASVRFQRSGDGAAIVRFQHPSSVETALRMGEVALTHAPSGASRAYVMQVWCECHTRRGAPDGMVGQMYPHSNHTAALGGAGVEPSAVGGAIIDAAGDWKCERCNNLNFAHRTRCNRCHAALQLSPAGMAMRPPPTRCPYTVMISPADRTKGGLQASDNDVVQTMRGFGEVTRRAACAWPSHAARMARARVAHAPAPPHARIARARR